MARRADAEASNGGRRSSPARSASILASCDADEPPRLPLPDRRRSRSRHRTAVMLSGRLFGPDDGSAGVVLAHMFPVRPERVVRVRGAAQAGRGYRVLTFNFRGYCPGGDAGCSQGEKTVSAIWQERRRSRRGAPRRGRRRGRARRERAWVGRPRWSRPPRRGRTSTRSSHSRRRSASKGLGRSRDVLAQVTAAKLFLAGHEDTTAAEAVDTLYAETLQPKRPVILTTGDHGTDILTGNQAGIASTEIIKWLERYLPVDGMSRPIVFLTDYGRSDAFVGICHGVMARIAPDAHVHRPLALRSTAERAPRSRRALSRHPRTCRRMRSTSRSSIPGSGRTGGRWRSRRARRSSSVPTTACCRSHGMHSGESTDAVEIRSPDVIIAPVSRTFHGRDVFAPAAAHLAAGTPLGDLGPAPGVASLERLDVPGPMVAVGAVGARVTATDGFGNVQLNATELDLDAAGVAEGRVLVVNGRRLPRAGSPSSRSASQGLIIDSDGHLAIVVNRGNAAPHARPRRRRRGRRRGLFGRRAEQVQPERVVLDREHLEAHESGLGRVLAEVSGRSPFPFPPTAARTSRTAGSRTHSSRRSRPRAHGLTRERLLRPFVHHEHRALVVERGTDRPQHLDRPGHVVDAFERRREGHRAVAGECAGVLLVEADAVRDARGLRVAAGQLHRGPRWDRTRRR